MNLYGLAVELDRLNKHLELYGMDETSYMTLSSLVEQLNLEAGKVIIDLPSFHEAKYLMDKQYIYDYS